jgi:hypothetical protein
MKKIFLMAVVAAAVGTSLGAHAQSTATAAQTSNSASTATNNGTNASTNTSGATATQSAVTSSSNLGNNQFAGGGAGGSGGQASAGAAGGNVTATISPTTTIQFNSPPTSRVESASVQDSNSRIQQSVSGTTETILSGTRTDRIEYSGTTTVKNVPSMNAPPLTSSNDTCMGSWSAGVAVAGFGASGGNTYADEHCKRIKMSRELWNKGMKAASLALDCMDRDAREALEITGFVCPQTTRSQQRASGETTIGTIVGTADQVVTGAVPITTPSPARAVVVSGASEHPRRPGYEFVNADDPYINRNR